MPLERMAVAQAVLRLNERSEISDNCGGRGQSV